MARICVLLLSIPHHQPPLEYTAAHKRMNILRSFVLIILLCGGCQSTSHQNAEQSQPLKALLITGGCCHDYAAQTKLLIEGIQKHANVEFDIIHEGQGEKDHIHSIFKTAGWLDGYDVVVHNECSAKLGDEIGAQVAKAHYESDAGVVMIHCAFHSFREMQGDSWRACLGADSRKHTHQEPVLITFDQPSHPILIGSQPFTTGDEELYVIDKVFEHSEVIATGHQGSVNHPVMFTNEYGRAKVFSVTLGHNTPTFAIDEWIRIVARGLLWTTDQLNPDGTIQATHAPVR